MKPTVGRVVYYMGKSGRGPYAAIISEVTSDEFVALHVLDPLASDSRPVELVRRVPFSELPAPGCWSWPPRV